MLERKDDVRYTRSYDPKEGYTPVNAGPIDIPTNSNSAPTPTDIPTKDLGDDDTMIFHVAAIVNDSPAAIIARLVDTIDSVE